MASRNSGGSAVSRVRGSDDKPTRQSFSCQECKRLKLKCSRTWPCTSCEKRGCAQICPDGMMESLPNKRLILAGTVELHKRISELEVALAKAHGKTSTSPHPLLESTYIFTKNGGPSQKNSKGNSGADGDDVTDGAFGTLTISNEGEAHFIGPFAGSQYLREQEDASSSGRSTPSADISASLDPISHVAVAEMSKRRGRAAYSDSAIALHDSFIVGGPGLGEIDVEMLREQLPDWDEEGRMLIQSYYDNVSWMYQIIPQAMFDQDHLGNAYDLANRPHAHKLACVFLMMAIGVMFDLNRHPWDARGERLFLLGRSCIGLIGLEHATPATVQALHLMGTYILNDRQGNGAEIFWPILGSAMKIALSLGLHRDGEAFGLSQYEVEERRTIFLEILTYDRLQALCFGRPCGSMNRTSDCKPPEDLVLFEDSDGFHRAKYRLIILMEKVIDIQTQTTPVSYTSVCELDKELKEFRRTLPASLFPNIAIPDLPIDRMIHPHLVIHRLGIRLLVAQNRLLLNRPAFARALKEGPEGPGRSKYGEGFLALYESAQDIVLIIKQLVVYHPSLVARWWFFWFHAFSSAVCLAAVAIKAPTCAFATPAFAGMSLVCDICAAARDGCRAKSGLPILLRLRERAHRALSSAGSSSHAPAAPGVNGTQADVVDELSHLTLASKLVRVGSAQGSSPKRAGSVHSPLRRDLREPERLSSPSSSSTQGQATGADAAAMYDPRYGNPVAYVDAHPNMSPHVADPGPQYPPPNWYNELGWPSNVVYPPVAYGAVEGAAQPAPEPLMSDIGTDMSMALGLGVGVPHEEMNHGFDFETFVSQMGGEQSFRP